VIRCLTGKITIRFWCWSEISIKTFFTSAGASITVRHIERMHCNIQSDAITLTTLKYSATDFCGIRTENSNLAKVCGLRKLFTLLKRHLTFTTERTEMICVYGFVHVTFNPDSSVSSEARRHQQVGWRRIVCKRTGLPLKCSPKTAQLQLFSVLSRSRACSDFLFTTQKRYVG